MLSPGDPGAGSPEQDAEQEGREEEDEKRLRHAEFGHAAGEWVERHGHRMPVRDCQEDQHDRDGQEDEALKKRDHVDALK